MQQKKAAGLGQYQTCKKTKSINVLHSNSNAGRPKISMEGKWLEQIGFHIGDRLQIRYGDKHIIISRLTADSQPSAVHESSGHMSETVGSPDMGQADGCRDGKDIKKKQIKVTSSMRVRQKIGPGGSFYYPMRPKISMEGKWLEQAGFCTGSRLCVVYWENTICIYPAA